MKTLVKIAPMLLVCILGELIYTELSPNFLTGYITGILAMFAYMVADRVIEK